MNYKSYCKDTERTLAGKRKNKTQRTNNKFNYQLTFRAKLSATFRYLVILVDASSSDASDGKCDLSTSN